LRILQTGAAWRFLPDEFPSPSTCWRWLKQWEEEGVWLNAWRALLGALDQEGLLKAPMNMSRAIKPCEDVAKNARLPHTANF
jgi:transposase